MKEQIAIKNESQSKVQLGKKLNPKIKFVLVISVLVIVSLFTSLVFLFLEYRELNSKLSDEAYLQELQLKGQQELISRTLEDVGNLILLPDESPTIAVIRDLDLLKKDNPEFYADAEIGDILVIYSKKALIYRDSIGKLVNVAPVIGEDLGNNDLPKL